jgi:hypothetical protein
MELLDIKQRFIELRAKGYSFDKIAKELGKAKQTLIDWSKEYQEEIANLKALELESLYEKHYLLKENRLQTFGEILSRLQDELKGRKLSDIPTEKLLELLLKYNSLINEEYIEPVFKSSEELEDEVRDRELLDELTNIKPSPQGDRKLKVV